MKDRQTLVAEKHLFGAGDADLPKGDISAETHEVKA
jgi:hypothetical protein